MIRELGTFELTCDFCHKVEIVHALPWNAVKKAGWTRPSEASFLLRSLLEDKELCQECSKKHEEEKEKTTP